MRQFSGNGGSIGQNGIRQRTETPLAGDFGARAPLGLVGQVDVFQFRLRGDCGNPGREVFGQLVLAAY